MDRLACVEVPDLRLQILLGRRPEWRNHPVAVVERDDPQAPILHVNARARSCGVRPGLRCCEGLAIEPALRAAAVTSTDVRESLDGIGRCLTELSPTVEPASDESATFWLDATGLVPLYPSLTAWAETVRLRLARLGLHATVAVGFTRFGTYVAARRSAARLATDHPPPAGTRPSLSNATVVHNNAGSPLHSGSSRHMPAHRSHAAESRASHVIVFDRIEDERAAAHTAPLSLLALPSELRATLSKLGIHTVGTFLRLPASGLLERFGSEAHRLYRLAAGDLDRPLVASSYQEPIEGTAVLDHPVTSTIQLLSIARRTLAPLLAELGSRRQAIATMHVLLALDDRDHVIETLQPAKPTLDGTVLLELLQLRLYGTHLPAPVCEVRLRLETVPADREQLRLFAAGTHRDLQAAARALARLRAEFGDGAVVRARLREGHLPEARFAWEPISQVEHAQPRRIKVRPLVRRIYHRPPPLPPRPPNERIDNWLLDRPRLGRIERTFGPYLVSGGWWNITVHREYHYVETARGDVLWLYYDRCRRRWRLHGRVE